MTDDQRHPHGRGHGSLRAPFAELKSRRLAALTTLIDSTADCTPEERARLMTSWGRCTLAELEELAEAEIILRQARKNPFLSREDAVDLLAACLTALREGCQRRGDARGLATLQGDLRKRAEELLERRRK